MRVLDRAQSRIPRPWRTLVDWFGTVAVAVALVLAFQAEVAKPYVIPSPSMEPTLHCAKPVANCEGRFSDRVIANRLAYRFRDPERGDIVVFRAPRAADRCELGRGGSPFVKRIVGLPGEVISERKGTIFVNGKRLTEPYVDPSRRGVSDGRWSRVAPGHYFMLGDNRTQSCDSRTWGTVPRSSLIGPCRSGTGLPRACPWVSFHSVASGGGRTRGEEDVWNRTRGTLGSSECCSSSRS
jgi:signal peptidase I